MIDANKQALVHTEVPLDPHPDDPWRDDKLKRKPSADMLTDMVHNSTGSPLVVSLNGDWGTGKTFFLKRWKAQLESEGFVAIYFNAWEDDSQQDPLIAILGQIEASTCGSQVAPLKQKLSAINLAALVKPAFLIGLRVIEGQTCVPLTDIHKAFAGSAPSDGNMLLSQYSEQKKARKQLKAVLSEIATGPYSTNGTDNPLVFIVDELDRCRPTFAMELLERIKHIFNVPNIVFVFGVNRQQLAHSVRRIYGNIDIDGYLNRFFDFNKSLPRADRVLFCRHVMNQYGISDHAPVGKCGNSAVECCEQPDCDRAFINIFLPHILGLAQLTLRDVEHYMRDLRFFLLVAKERAFMEHLEIVPILILLRHQHREVYENFIEKKERVAVVLNYLHGDMLSVADYARHYSTTGMKYAEVGWSYCEGRLYLYESMMNEQMYKLFNNKHGLTETHEHFSSKLNNAITRTKPIRSVNSKDESLLELQRYVCQVHNWARIDGSRTSRRTKDIKLAINYQITLLRKMHAAIDLTDPEDQ